MIEGTLQIQMEHMDTYFWKTYFQVMNTVMQQFVETKKRLPFWLTKV